MSDTPPAILDDSLASVIDVLVELMRTATRPEVLEAQRVLLQRLAYQGDVFPSRIPAPRNITEIGGYLNLLETAGLGDVRATAVTSALGVAGPVPSLATTGGAVPVGFVEMANDRPGGPAQASIPPTLAVRADLHGPLQAALAGLHAVGCQLPLRAARPALPAAGWPGEVAPAAGAATILASLGRSLEVFPGTVLTDPAVDPVAVARPETPSTEAMRLVVRELDGGTLVTEASWVSLTASSTSAAENPPAPQRFLALAPVLEAAGWYHPAPPVLPASLAAPGTLVHFVNLTGLVAGETTLGDELALLFPAADIARSSLRDLVTSVWDGDAFVAPA